MKGDVSPREEGRAWRIVERGDVSSREGGWRCRRGWGLQRTGVERKEGGAEMRRDSRQGGWKCVGAGRAPDVVLKLVVDQAAGP